MLKFNEYRAFYSERERNEYNDKDYAKKVVYINPDYIIAIESVGVGGVGVYPSSWDATRIHTVHGHWTVEGNQNTIAEVISTAAR